MARNAQIMDVSKIRHRRFRLRVCKLAVAVIVIGCGLLVVRGLYIGYSRSLKQSNAVHATTILSEVVADHVREHGTWPDSDVPLTEYESREIAGMKWPEDKGEIEALVRVRYDANCDVVVQQGARAGFTSKYLSDGALDVYAIESYHASLERQSSQHTTPVP